MTTRVIFAVSAVACMLLVPWRASAQRLDLKTPEPARLPEHAAAPRGEQHGRPLLPESDLYPHRPPVPYAPGFVAPLSKETAGGRAGIAGWTAPNTPVGSRRTADPDNAGWLGFGFATEWGGSPKARGRN